MSNGTALTMELREEKFVQFKPGDLVEGVLVRIDRVMVQGKPAVKYTVRDEDGHMLSFMGTVQLNSKILLEDKGHLVSVRYIGENTMVKRGDNCMREFEVFVSKELATQGRATVGDALEITDDDIGF